MNNDIERVDERIFELIKRQMVKLMSSETNYEYFKNYNIVLSNEQQFVRNQDREPNTIYIVVKFLPSSLIFGQYIQNITITAISEQNGVDVCRTLLNEYGLEYNLNTSEDEEIKQVYTTPLVANNFNEIYSGFRSLLSMSGTFIVSKVSNPFRLFYNDKEIECLSTSFTINMTPNTQPYFNSQNFTRSIIQYGTFTIGFSTYLTDNELLNKCLDIGIKDLVKEPKGVNSDFVFTLVFKNGRKLENAKFKFISEDAQQHIGEIPIVSLTFTN